jgi:hypothetical protein
VAVWRSSDSVRSRLRASSSVRRRAFSTAMTAWSANVCSKAISIGENPPGCARVTLMAPTASRPRSIGTETIERKPRSTASRRKAGQPIGSVSMSTTCCTALVSTARPGGVSASGRCGAWSRASKDSLLPGKPPRAAARRMNTPSYWFTPTDHAPNSRMALSAMASKTGCTSVCAWLMARRMSAVAVCRSSDSVRSRLRAWISVSSRAFLTAITAWSANVCSSPISAGENPPGSARETAMMPRTSAPLSMGTCTLERQPRSLAFSPRRSPQDGSVSMPTIC